MSDETSAQSVAAPASTDAPETRPAEVKAETNGAKVEADVSSSNGVAPNETAKDVTLKEDSTNDVKAVDSEPATENSTDKPEVASSTSEIVKPASNDPTDAAPAEESAEPAAVASATTDMSKSRRKSAGVPEHKGKKLNRKASKAKITHTDAKPGDYFYIKLKGYPLWPGVVCDEDMLPTNLLNSRPVTAAKPDGTYRAEFEDGGKKVAERTFPVMYLFTNEFGWIPNTDLQDIDLDTVGDIPETTKMRKDLLAAHKLAAEKHDLDHWKQVLKDFEETRQAEAEAYAAELIAAEEAAEAAAAAKAAKAATPKTKKKSKPAVDNGAENDDVEMADVDAENEEKEKPKSSKKRKAVAEPDESSNTPAKTDSVKKPKIKLTTSATPKANGTGTPKSSKKDASASKPKSKPKKGTNGSAAEPDRTTKEPELSSEEKRQKKEKEILFLRHKLQKGLLTRDQQPKEEDMKQMSEFISKLEGYADLEVSIIRATKINKVLKAILKLDEIPKESEFSFKNRSQSLLGKWNKILESETPSAAAGPANGTESKENSNGVEHTPEAIAAKPEDPEEKDAETVTPIDPDTTMKDAPEKTETEEAQPKLDEPVESSIVEATA